MGPSVAVKRLLPHLVKDVGVVRMFLNEARITAQIDHPNVVRILDLGQEAGEPFIAMELLEGRSLADMRQAAAETGQRVPLGVTLRVLAEACRGLDAAHRAVDENGHPLAIVHRDFSPDNIHVGVDGRIKVIDFGIATAANVSSGTEPGTLKGKFFYMSPEMIAGHPVDHRADLFAAGVMLYEQLCGRRPFTGLSTDEVLQRITEGRPRRPSSFDPSVPVMLEAVCLTALSHHPAGRFPSLKEFIHALESVETTVHVATPEEVADYMNQVFPPDADAQRRLLREARARDPSLPHVSSDPPYPASQPPHLASEPPNPTEAVTLPPSDAPVPAPASPSAPLREAKRNRSWTLALGGVVVLLGVGIGMAIVRPWAVKALPPAPELLRKDIQAQLDAHSPEQALALARRYGEIYPQDSEAAVYEARAYMALRQGRKADAALDRAVLLNPLEPAPDVVRAELRQMQGDLSGALDALGQALKKRAHDRTLLRRRALLLSQANRLDEAEMALGALLQKRYDPEAAAELAFVKLRQDQNREALKESVALLRKALRRQPKLAQAHYYLGAALAKEGDAEEAEREYREAVDQAPLDPRPLSALCQLLARRGRSSDAETTRKLLASRFPDQADLLTAECKP
jgi:serine/threonine protein kinase/Flp pilus assembly protein TadD